MKAFLIDTPNKQITEVDVNFDDYTNVYPFIHAEIFELVYINSDDKDFIYVDEEGMLNGNPHGWFYPAGYHQPLRGYGLVSGDNNFGGNQEPNISIEALRAMITFPTDEEVAARWTKR